MRWFLLLPPHDTGLYIAFWVLGIAYTAFAIIASVASGAHRARIHRGSWVHLAEGWAFVAVVWTALAWSHYYLTVHSWPHVAATPAVPWLLQAAALGVWVLRPIAVLAPVLMVVTTLVHLRRPPAEWMGSSPATRPVPPRPSAPRPV